MLAIDTLKLSEDLKEGGFDEIQTATLVDLGRTLSNQALEKLATKDDLRLLKDDLHKDMTALEERMDNRLASLEQRMVIKLGSLIIAGVGFLVLLDRLFP